MLPPTSTSLAVVVVTLPLFAVALLPTAETVLSTGWVGSMPAYSPTRTSQAGQERTARGADRTAETRRHKGRTGSVRRQMTPQVVPRKPWVASRSEPPPDRHGRPCPTLGSLPMTRQRPS